MSGLVAAMAVRSARLDIEAFSGASDAAAYRGAARVYFTESVALAALGAARCRGPLAGSVPAAAATPQPTIAFQGVLHNRSDLVRQLHLDGDAEDAAVALAAYAQWKQQCASKLLGEFAFVVWDPLMRVMYAARDPLGLRPFYYCASTAAFIAASDVLPILAFEGGIAPVNEGMVAEHLADAVTSWDETVYSGIFRLPPGHWLSVAADGGVRRHQYWNPAELPEDSGRSDDDYAEEFRHLFTEAVRCRLGPQRMGLFFSGGVDSSAIAGVVSSLRPSPLPPAFSLTFGDDEELDELRYIRDVTRWCRLESVVTRACDPSTRPPAPFNRDPLDWRRDFAADEWKAQIRRQGIRAVLTGRGGDDAFFGSQFHYAGMLRQGRVTAMLQQWRDDAVVDGSPPALRDLVQFGLWPLLPRRLRRVMAPVARAVAGQRIVPEWIEPQFARRVCLEDRLRPVRRRPHALSPSRDDIIRSAYESGWKCSGREVSEREAVERGLEERHPFLDQRIVEFGLRLPDDQRWRGPMTRYVVRRALHDLLPPSLRSRTSSGDGTARVLAAVRSMRQAIGTIPLRAVEAGWLKVNAVETLQTAVQSSSVPAVPGYALAAVCAAELWFRPASVGRYTATRSHARNYEEPARFGA